MPSLYLNSFHPLASTRAGVSASEAHGLDPFIDGSIRREPDFEHPAPAITYLCRADRFTPRLREGDVVAYMTIKGRYREPHRHQRMVCILKVEQLFDSHQAAAAWYTNEACELPNNLMVPGNKANPLSHSHQGHRSKKESRQGTCGTRARPKCGQGGSCNSGLHREWDAGYRQRARMHGRVASCSVLFVNTQWSAPIVTDEILRDVFGKVPATRNPGRLDISLLPSLMKKIGIHASLSSR